MSLAEIARQVVAARPTTRPPSDGGPSAGDLTHYVRERLQVEDPGEYADSTIATVAWRLLRHTRPYQSLVARLGATPAIWRLGDFVVTPLREGSVSRFVLLALDPTLPPEHSPATAEVDLSQSDLQPAYERWAQRMRQQGDYGSALANATKPDIVSEFAETQGLQLVVAAMPLRFEYTAERPTPPFAVKDAAGAQDVSMGLYSKSTQHGPGLTTAEHGITGGGSYYVFDAAGAKIDSVQGIVTNSVLDAAFLKLSKAPAIPSPAGGSILSGVTPNAQLQHDFHGAQSGRAQATVSGWVDDLLTVEPWLQNRVFTDPIAQQGDSGSALIDANDRVIGFAFYTSTFAKPSLSAWIWADSVKQDFQLT
jgi:hypothetical protein